MDAVIAGDAAVKESVKKWAKAALTIVLTVVAAGLLTACEIGNDGPPQALVGQAIALQVERTQQVLSPALKLPVPTLKDIVIKRVQIADRTPLTILGQPAYRLQGTYDLKLQQAKQQATQQGFPFEVYLLKRSEGKTVTWQVAEPMADSWTTRSLPLEAPPIGKPPNRELNSKTDKK
jgi:hypothetical protein